MKLYLNSGTKLYLGKTHIRKLKEAGIELVGVEVIQLGKLPKMPRKANQ